MSQGVRYLAGEDFNLLTRGTVTVSPGSSALFPPAALCDGRTALKWQASANSANPYIQVDLRSILDGRFEAGITGWTEAVTPPGATSESVVVHGGAKALCCNAGVAGMASRYLDKTFRAGERLKLSGWINAPAGCTGQLRIQNLVTGHYLVGGVWQAAAGAAAQVVGGAAYTEATSTFVVESVSLCGDRFRVPLRTTCWTDSNGDVLFDDVHIFPGVNFASAHGHNHTPTVVPELRSSTDAWGTHTVEASLTIRQPSYYGLLAAAVYAPDWRLYLAGTNYETPIAGEVVLGYAEDPEGTVGDRIRFYDQPKISYEMPLVSQQTESGELYSGRKADEMYRVLRMGCVQESLVAFARWRDDLWRRSYGGELPIVIVPSASHADVVIHGRLMSTLEALRVGYAVWTNEILVRESGFPPTGA